MDKAWIPLITATLVLLAGVIDDLRSRKVHNELVIGAVLVALVVTAICGGWSGTLQGLGGFAMALALAVPLVLLNIMGAGDMKLLTAFGLLASWNTVYQVLVFAIIWGALFGVVQILLAGELVATLKNLGSILQLRKRSSIQLHHVPFTVAIMLGWLSYLKYDGVI